jgi:hypothetical protein
VVAAQYEIVIRGRLGGVITRSLEGLEVRSTDAEATHLSGWFVDQPALHGALARLADLGLELVAVRRLPESG